MSWYGIPISSEFLFQISIFAGIGISVLKFNNPNKFRLRLRPRLRVLSRQDPLFRFGFYGSILILLIIVFLYGTPYCEEDKECVSKFSRLLESSPNEVGDALAGVASTLAFLWIILTVMMQSKELKAQRSELQMTRAEHRRQRQLSEANLVATEHDSLIRDQQEAWRHFEALLYEFLYAIEWHRGNRKFCKWLFGKEVQKPTQKQGLALTEIALDLFFLIRKRKNSVEDGSPWSGSETRVEWSSLLRMINEIVALEDNLPAYGKAQLRISRLKITRGFLIDVSENPKKWADQDEWFDT
jgi:hypothetical protein